MSDPRILVGAFAGAFGVKGEVRLKSFCADPAAIASYGPLWTEDGTRSFALRITRAIPGGLAVRVAGVATREAAEALRGTTLHADRARLPSLPDDEFYHADLIGLVVTDPGGARLGTVRAIHNHGAGDILEIHDAGQRTALLLPFTRANVPTVDLTAGRIVADPPEEVQDESGPEQGGAGGGRTE
jgi:16S rRNA processing protein RimM